MIQFDAAIIGLDYSVQLLLSEPEVCHVSTYLSLHDLNKRLPTPSAGASTDKNVIISRP
jgi:hypothetical protein